MIEGQKIVFTDNHAGHNGAPTILAGDTATYLGHSRVRMTSGEADGWVLVLTILARYKEIDK